MVKHYFRNKIRDLVKSFLYKYAEYEYSNNLSDVSWYCFDKTLLWVVNITITGFAINLPIWYFGATLNWYSWFFWGLSAWTLKQGIKIYINEWRYAWK